MISTTGQPIPGRPVAEGQSINRQYSQALEQFANDPARVADRERVDNEREENRRLIASMTEEQKAAARATGVTPATYLRTLNNNTNYEGLFQKR